MHCHFHLSPPPATPGVLRSPHHDNSELGLGAGTVVGSGELQTGAKGYSSLE